MRWPIARLDSIAATGSGGTPSRQSPDRYFGGPIPWIKSGELRDQPLGTSEETITESALQESSAKLVPAGSVLIAMYGATVGRTALLKVEAATNQAVCYITPIPQLAEPRYIWHFLRSHLSDLLRKRVGGAQPNISQRIVRSTRLPLPPLSEQRRIVELLDQADALRRKRAEADATAERILPALFREMFGDPALNSKGWRIRPLNEVISDTRNGLYKPANFCGRGVQILKMFNIQNGLLNLDRVDLIEVSNEELEAFGLRHGDLLMNRVNTPELVGKCALIPDGLGQTVFESKNIRIRVKRANANPAFVNHFLNTTYGHAMLCRGVKHAIGMATINNSDLRNCPIPLPPIEVQNRWASRAAAVHNHALRTAGSSTRIDRLFNVLLHHAFTGALTSRWREGRMAELLAEMEHQARALGLPTAEVNA